MLGGSLARIHVSLYHGRFWLVRQHRKRMPAGLRFASATEKTTTTIQLLWPRITERENLVVSYCKLQIILHSAAAHTSLYSLWMQGKLVSAPPKTAHSCAGSMAGSVPVLSIPKQPAKRIQPEPRRQNFFFWGLTSLRLVLPHIQPANLPPTRPGEIISLFSRGLQFGSSFFFFR